MRKLRILLVIAGALALAACGGGDDNTLAGGSTTGSGSADTGGNTANAAAITATASSATLPADGSSDVTITAYVRDADNSLLAGVPVTFTASSGGVSGSPSVTNDAGAATAILSTAGDNALRTITVTASADSLQATVDVQVIQVSTATTQIGSLTLLTSNPQIPSDGSNDTTISALVRDDNNNVMEGVSVGFSADTGSLVVSQPSLTNASGVATATLSTGGDPTNRSITVTATAGSLQQTIAVDVAGTNLQINGPDSLPLGTNGTYTVVLTDAGGTGIPNKEVSIDSANGNGISATPITTDSLGHAAFTLNATAAGTETLTAGALGIESKHSVSISSDVFQFTSPTPPPATPQEVKLGQNQTITVNWKEGNVAVANQEVDFSTTRGTLSAQSQLTDSAGNASVTLSANNAGPAVITATNAKGTSIQASVEFVATTPANLELQASPFSVSTNGQSAITAIVRDANGNLVKNQTVNFVLNDVTGGSLSVAQAVTDSQGRAQTFYNASSTTSAVDGVRVDATVQGFPTVTGDVKLTVAQRQVFISLGTGNQIEEPNPAQYKKTWIAQVTDAQGNAVKGVELSFSVLSDLYYQGDRVWDDTDKIWNTVHTTPNGCQDEDINNRDGVLDPTEDLNGSGKIEAGNIATAVAGGGSGGTVTTDANGFALIDLYWPQEYAGYVEVTLEARSPVQGSESSASTTFLLDGLASDFSNKSVPPPGEISPFGKATDCAIPPPGTP